MDNDLTEAVQALKTVFEKRFIPANFAKNDPSEISTLKRELELSDRYAAFLTAADPLDVETATPAERIRFIPSAQLAEEQAENPDGWRDGWVVIAHSALLGDPYFIDIKKPDAEGDCPVYTMMTGTDRIEPVLCASSFASFIQILAMAMQIAEDFKDDGDPDDEHIFRETLSHKLRPIDQAALKVGHWTRR